MRSKRSIPKKGANTRVALYSLELSRRAKAEVQALVKRSQAGTLNRVQLKSGLKEVDERLERLLAMIRHFL